MVGVASVVIVCAVLLYVNDLRDRWRHDQMLVEDQHQRRRDLDSHKQMETIASSSGYFHNQQPDFVEDLSISHVSTMTFSIADGLRLADDSDGEELESSLYITELNDAHRVCQDIDLSSLIDLSLIKTMTPMDDDDDDDDDSRNDEDEDNENGYETPEESITTFDRDDEQDYSVGPDPISTSGEDSSESEDYDEGDSGWSSPYQYDVSSDESSIETFLTNRMSRAGSKEDASTSGSVDTMPQRLGEQCLEVSSTPQKERHDMEEEEEGEDPTSFELSPDTSYSDTSSTTEERSKVSYKVPPRLDQFFHGKSTAKNNNSDVLPVQEYTKPASPDDNDDGDDDDQDSYIRDIYFVPVAANTVVDLGIQLHDASCTSTHPLIASVQENSPLAGRLFEGDILLAVNNVETTGLCGALVSKSFSENAVVQQETPGDNDDELSPTSSSQGAQVVKLTVMSSIHDSDDDSDSSSSSTTMPRSIDTGRSETAVEV
jgi:hypothetical protein